MPSTLEQKIEDSTTDIRDLKQSREAALVKKDKFRDARILRDLDSLAQSQAQLKADLEELSTWVKATRVEVRASIMDETRMVLEAAELRYSLFRVRKDQDNAHPVTEASEQEPTNFVI